MSMICGDGGSRSSYFKVDNFSGLLNDCMLNSLLMTSCGPFFWSIGNELKKVVPEHMFF